MSEAGNIIKQGSSHNRLCGHGIITLREGRIEASCPRGQTVFQFMLNEITQFRMTKQGFYIDNFYCRMNERIEWMEAIKHALDANGIEYEATGYHII